MDQGPIFCYNCEKYGFHKSRSCPSPQRQTRCPACNNVCCSESGHHWLCGNKSFKSKSFNDSTVFPSSEVLEMDFPNVRDLAIVDGKVERPIMKTPTFIANANMFVHMNDRNRIAIYSFSSNNQPHCFSVVDGTGAVRLCVTVSEDCFEVNQRYRIEKDGTVIYNAHNKGTTATPTTLRFKVFEKDLFRMRLFKFERWTFDVYPAGVLMLDPMQDELRK